MDRTSSLTKNQLAFGWCYWLGTLGVIPGLLKGVLIVFGLSELDATWPLWHNISYFSANFLVLGLVFRSFLWKEILRFFQKPLNNLRLSLQFFLIYYCLETFLSWAIAALAPDFQNENNNFILELSKISFPLVLISITVLVPLAEEILFRGVIFQSLKQLGRPAAHLLCALLFSLIHIVGYIGSDGYGAQEVLICICQYALPALCLSLAYDFSGTLLCPILIHSVINLSAILK